MGSGDHMPRGFRWNVSIDYACWPASLGAAHYSPASSDPKVNRPLKWSRVKGTFRFLMSEKPLYGGASAVDRGGSSVDFDPMRGETQDNTISKGHLPRVVYHQVYNVY